MAILFMDSFDHYSTSGGGMLNKYQGSFGLGMGTGRDGTGQCLSGGVTKTFSNYYSSLYIGQGRKFYTVSSETVLTATRIVGGSTVATLDIVSLTNGTLYFTYDPSTASASSSGSSTPVTLGIWYHLGILIDLTTTSCRVRLYINEGNLILDQTLSGWSAESAVGLNTFTLRAGLGMDDLYFTDGSNLGDLKIGVMRTESDDSVQWTKLSGAANYEMVDETLVDQDTTYNYTSTINHKDIFVMTDIPTDATVHACQAVTASRKDTAGTASIKTGWKPSTTEYQDAEFFPSETQYLYDIVVRNTNPDTAAAWTPSELNGMKMTYQRIS